ncbi:hypothetical protein HAX54_024274, partial [Datura stramonium]|nr:hypothetical protein [Datura stramonium]
ACRDTTTNAPMWYRDTPMVAPCRQCDMPMLQCFTSLGVCMHFLSTWHGPSSAFILLLNGPNVETYLQVKLLSVPWPLSFILTLISIL